MHFVYKDSDGKYHRCEGGVDPASPEGDFTVGVLKYRGISLSFVPTGIFPTQVCVDIFGEALKKTVDAFLPPEADQPTIVGGEK